MDWPSYKFKLKIKEVMNLHSLFPNSNTLFSEFVNMAYLPTWVSILVAGFLGSWHCGLMCGPMACYIGQKKQLLTYQAGRLISYSILGLMAGLMTQRLISFSNSYKFIVIVIMFLILIFSFLNVNTFSLFTKNIHFKKINLIPKYLIEQSKNSGFILGLISALLPCGWLWSFLVAAATTKSPIAGMIVMFLFWISSLPALSAAAMALKKMTSTATVKQQQISKLVLLLAGIYSLAMFWL